jgi:tetratricopeptide (TPR) repeat protein
MKQYRIPVIFITATFAALLSLSGARAENVSKPASGTKVSEVDFPISCGAAAQKQFNQAVWILHSFWYDEAVKAFTEVTEIEPDCAMGYWGIAMSYWYPLWYPPNAQTGDIAGAETEIAKLQLLKQKLDQAKDDYWAKQVEVQRLGASGILAHARANDQQAVELVRAAAELDATMDKHPATPAEVVPARELLADLLLELNDPTAALEEYEQSLRTDRNRFRSLLGVARAAKQTGDTPKAREAYEKLVTLAVADTDRPELDEAKAFLSN